MQIRRFNADLKVKIPGNHPGLYGVPIQMNRAQILPEKWEEFAKQVNGRLFSGLLIPTTLSGQVMRHSMRLWSTLPRR